MAALASRSHEWLEWEIRECDESIYRQPTGSTPESEDTVHDPRQTVTLSISLPATQRGQMGHAAASYRPESASPSESVSELIKRAAQTEVAEFHFSSWEQNTSAGSNKFDPQAATDPLGTLRAVLGEIESTRQKQSGQARLTVRTFRVKNSRGFNASFGETELTVTLGAHTVFNSHRWDVNALRKALLLR